MKLWADEQLVVTVDGPGGVRELVVAKPFARVGGHPDSEVVLDAPGVAKRALYLHATCDGVFCLDLDMEDSVAQKRGRWLREDEAVRVGPYALTARLASAAGRGGSPPPSPVAWGSAGVPLPVINVHCQRLLKDKRRFRARLNLVGRRPQCALQLRGARVSSFHCALFWDQRRLWCVDLLSSNGTQLNGEKFDCGELLLNDRLDVGEFTLVYYRWSPRRSMQPGWQPEQDALRNEHEAAEGHDSSPVLDAAPPPLGIEADLALATHLAEEEGSGIVRDAATELKPVPDRQAEQGYLKLRQELVEELQRLAQEREQLRAESAAHAAAVARWDSERAEFAAARQAWHAERQELSEQLTGRIDQTTQLQAALDAAHGERDSLRGQLKAQAARLGQERTAWESQTAEAGQRLAEQAAQAQAEAAQQSRQRMAAEAATRDLQAQQEALAAQLAENARRAQRLETELAAARGALDEQRAQFRAVTEERDAALALAAAPHPPGSLPEQELRCQQLTAEVNRLTQERDELHGQWSQSSERFSRQIAQLNAEIARLAAEHDAAAAARDEWQRERRKLTDRLNERGQQLATLRAELNSAAEMLAQRQAEALQRETESKAAAQQKDAQIARLTLESRDLKTQWAAATQQLAAQEDRLQGQAARLAEERTSIESDRQAWQAERLSLAEQLAGRSQQLEKVKSVLAAAQAELAKRSEELARARAAAESPEELPLVLRVPDTASDQQPAAPEAASDSATAEPHPWAEAIAAASPPPPAGEALTSLARTEPRGGRRSKAQKHEITTFVGDRLIDLEHSQRRRSLILWASVAAGTLVLSALIVGGWYLFH